MLRTPRRSSPGFTTIELMIALVIIGVIAATIAPGLTEVLADNRQSSAAMDIVRLARKTRAQAITTGLAHLLRYRGETNRASAYGLGTMAVHVGMNSKCLQTPWAQSLNPPANSNQGPTEIFHMVDYNPTNGVTAPRATDQGRHVIELIARIGGATQDVAPEQTATFICYQPNGEIYTGAAADALAVQVQPLLIVVHRSVNAEGRGQDRHVLFPVGGNARLR